jgi:hypothetical protein
MADYQLTDSEMVIRVADQVWIPDDPANRDWIGYQQWLADGGVPDPAPPVIDPELDGIGAGKTAAQILGAA